MRASLARLLELTLLATIAACQAGGEEAAAPRTRPAAPPDPDLAEKLRHCPLTVDGVDVSLTDTEGGIRFALTAASEPAVAEVRRRAHHMAEFTSGRGRDQHGGGKGGGFMRNCPVVSKDTSVVASDIERGVVVVVTATQPEAVDELRAETRRRLAALRSAPPR